MIVSSLLRGLVTLWVPAALAASGYNEACVGLPAGTCTPQNVLINFIPPVGSLLVGLAGGGAVLFTIIGGVQMFLSGGDDSAGTKGKHSIMYAIGGFVLALASQAIVTFVHTRAVAAGLVVAATPHLDFMAAAVGAILSLMNVAFVAVVMYAAVRLVLAWGKSEELTKVWNMLLWVIIGALVINASSALVHAVLRLGL